MNVDLPEKENLIRSKLSSGDINDALINLIYAVFDSYRDYPNCLFYSKFDKILEELGCLFPVCIKAAFKSKIHILIATEFQVVGGHTRIAREMANLSENSILVLTDTTNSLYVDTEYLKKIEAFMGQPIIVTPPGAPLEKINWLHKFIDGIQPSLISHLNNHWDPISIVASINSGFKNVYIHHCDGNPSLGASISDFEHVDITNSTHEACNKRTIFKKGKFILPLFHKKGPKSSFFKGVEKGVSTISAGASHKYIFGNHPESYDQFILFAIRSTGREHHHLGHLPDHCLEMIYKLLLQNEINNSKFIYYGNVENFERPILDIVNPIFIPSFPSGGGMALVETMSLNIPILSYKKPSCDILTLKDQQLAEVIPPDCPTFSNFEELNEKIKEISINYRLYSEKSQKHFEKNYAQTVFHNAFLNINK